MAGFKKAQRTAAKVKCSLQGASGSGKTYSALKIATALVTRTDPGKRVAMIDAEKSAALYSPPFDFDVDDDFGPDGKVSYTVDKLIEKMETARKAGCYGAVIVDSATHFWKESGGLLSMIDSICQAQKAKGQKGDSFAAWKTVDPIYRKLMTYIRNYPLHVFLCIRAKQAYEKVEGANGKGSIKKVGVEPEFREGFEFEVDAQFALDENHRMIALKHRLGEFLDGKVFSNPGDDVAEALSAWLAEGAPGQDTVVVAAAAEAPPAPVAASNDNAPDTSPMPPTEQEPGVLPTPPPQDDVTKESLTAEIDAAKTENDLKTFGKRMQEIMKAKTISDTDYKLVAQAYKTRLQSIRSAA